MKKLIFLFLITIVSYISGLYIYFLASTQAKIFLWVIAMVLYLPGIALFELLKIMNVYADGIGLLLTHAIGLIFQFYYIRLMIYFWRRLSSKF